MLPFASTRDAIRGVRHTKEGSTSMAHDLLLLAAHRYMKEETYTAEIILRHSRLIIGVVALGILIVLYLAFFCPTECH
jgi:hypothetical protein